MSQDLAVERAASILRHLLVSQQNLSLNSTNATVESAIVPNPSSSQDDEERTGLRRLEDVQQDFSIREFDPVDDDAAFRALDYLCSQGVKTKLVTEFLMKYKFEEIQPDGWCCVAEDLSGTMVGAARSYIYECLVNGVPAVTSYVFLVRVHPHFRRKNLALWLTAQLFFQGLQTSDIDYMSSWVVVDNVQSIGLQDRIAVKAKELHGMPAPDTLGTYRNLGGSLEDLKKIPSVTLTAEDAVRMASSEMHFVKLDGASEVEICQQIHAKTQFLPTDLDQLFGFELHIGTYVIRHRDAESGPILAYLTVWNSGEVRVSIVNDSHVRSDGSMAIYNPWYDESPLGVIAFEFLIKNVLAEMATEGFRFAFFFFPEDYTVNDEIVEACKIDVPWRARIWYVSNVKKIQLEYSSAIFYDPRQCLM